MAMASPQYQQWKRQSVRRSAARLTRVRGVMLDEFMTVRAHLGNRRRVQRDARCTRRPIASSETSELLPEFDSELHGFDGVDMRIQQAIVDPIVALRIFAQLAALVEGVLDEGFEMPVVEAGAGREIERGERRRVARISAGRFEAIGGGTLVRHRSLHETLVL